MILQDKVDMKNRWMCAVFCVAVMAVLFAGFASVLAMNDDAGG